MGLIQNIIDNWKQKKEEDEELPDNVTRDKYLRSLRRQRRMQLEELEKERLKKAIARFNKEREQQHLWGVKRERADPIRPHRSLPRKQRWI